MNDNKYLFRYFFPLVLILLLGLGVLVLPVQAVEETLELASSACLSCHENLYYQFDTGKHYCLTEAAARCVDCHAGDPTALQVEAAHAGLVTHPILNGDIGRCLACHPLDAELHVEKFAALAGFSSSVQVALQSAPLRTIPSEAATSRGVDPGQLAGLAVVLGAISALLVICLLISKSCHG